MTFEEAIIKEFDERFNTVLGLFTSEFEVIYNDKEGIKVPAKDMAQEIREFLIDALAKYKAGLLAEVEKEVIGEADSYTRKIVNNTYAKQLELRRLIELVQQQRQKLSELKGKNE